MNNVGKRVRIKNYFPNFNDRIGTIIKLNGSGVTYTVEFNDGKEPTDCVPYIETHRFAQCELIEKEFVLPAKWKVIRNSSNAAVLNKWNNDKYCNGSENAYRTDFGVMYSDRNYNTLNLSEEYTEITFEQFKQYVLKEDSYKLPDKWYINRSLSDTITDWFRAFSGAAYSYGKGGEDFLCFPGYDNSSLPHSCSIRKTLEDKEYKEISLEIFNKYVLKENITEMKVGDKLSDYIFPSSLMCHRNSRGDLYQGDLYQGGVTYNLNKFYDRRITAIENGFFEVSSFVYGWFKLDEKITKKQTNMEKKIIGYKFKEGCKKYEDAALKICEPTDIDDFNSFEKKGYIVNMTVESTCKTKLEAAKVLDLWFEPVFSEDYKKITVGSNNTQVIVKQNGKIEFRGQYTEIQVVNALLEDFDIESRVIGTEWKTSIPKSIRFIQIGCDSESNRFSIEDLELIKETYNSLK